MLRFTEELLLLLSEERSGELLPLPERMLHLALAGAVLMELQLENRIDTDLDVLFPVDPSPLDDPLLDPTLNDIAGEKERHDARSWVERVARRGPDLVRDSIARLVERGIIEADQGGLLVLIPLIRRSRRYPVIDGEAREEVRLRIMRVLFSEDVPDPRDIVLICLADACDLFPWLLTRSELEQARERIDLVRRLDLVGQALTRAMQDIPRRPAEAPPRLTREPPLAPGLPVVGNALSVASNVRAFFTEQYLKLGPVFRIRILSRPYTVLAGAEANMFLQTQGRLHFRSYEYFARFREELGTAHFLPGLDGAEHTRLRQTKNKGYSRAVLEGNIGEVINIIRRHTAEWPVETPLPGLDSVRYMMVDQVGTLMTGVSPRPYLQDFEVFSRALILSRSTGRLAKTRRYRRARRRLDELYRAIMAVHEAPPGERRPDLIDDVLELHRTDPVFLPEADLMASAMGPLIAGFDTATGTCAFMLYALLKYPDLLARMRAEADELYAEGTPAPAGLRRMDVTRRIMMETMRMYPIAPALQRKVINPFEFGGYTIAAGADVFVATTVPHYLPEYYPDPLRFDIDRYLPGREEHRARGAYAPFGMGTHRCLGNNFAEMQIALTLATILRDFDLELYPPDYTLKVHTLPTPRPDKKFRFKAARRLHAM